MVLYQLTKSVAVDYYSLRSEPEKQITVDSVLV